MCVCMDNMIFLAIGSSILIENMLLYNVTIAIVVAVVAVVVVIFSPSHGFTFVKV